MNTVGGPTPLGDRSSLSSNDFSCLDQVEEGGSRRDELCLAVSGLQDEGNPLSRDVLFISARLLAEKFQYKLVEAGLPQGGGKVLLVGKCQEALKQIEEGLKEEKTIWVPMGVSGRTADHFWGRGFRALVQKFGKRVPEHVVLLTICPKSKSITFYDSKGTDLSRNRKILSFDLSVKEFIEKVRNLCLKEVGHGSSMGDEASHLGFVEVFSNVVEGVTLRDPPFSLFEFPSSQSPHQKDSFNCGRWVVADMYTQCCSPSIQERLLQGAGGRDYDMILKSTIEELVEVLRGEEMS